MSDDYDLIERLGNLILTEEECKELEEIVATNRAYHERERENNEYTVTFKPAELSEKQLEARERSRKQIAKLNKYEIKFLGKFKNGMVWNNSNEPYLDLKGGIFHDVGGSKTSNHLIPVGGTMWDKFSVPKNKMKIVRRVSE